MIENHRTVIIHKRLRPLRLTFLIEPNDGKSLRRIFQINSCLWGGIFNTIVPIFKRIPRRWSDSNRKGYSVQEFTHGYLDAFEPDFVVPMNNTLAKSLSISEDRIISPEDILKIDEEQSTYPINHGIDVTDLFWDLYKKEFQFQRRHPVEIVLPTITDRKMQMFTSACFGEFPDGERFKYIHKEYKEAFGANEINVEPSNMLKLFLERKGYPLNMGSAGIEVVGSNHNVDPSLFYMDSESNIDLIDFWNLRAIGYPILPIPKQWATDLIQDVSKLIAKNYVPYRRNKDMMHKTSIICSRSSSFEELEEYEKKLNNKQGRSLSQHWYPRIWDEWARDKDHTMRCSLTYKEEKVQTIVSEGSVNYRTISPKFSDRRFGPRWANVIEVFDHNYSADSAPVIPPGMSNLHRALDCIGIDNMWSTREGIVLLGDLIDWDYTLPLPTAEQIFRIWMKEKGFELIISSAGKITRQIIRTLGGLLHTGLLANEEVLKKLNEMAHANVEEVLEEEQNKSKVRAKTVSVKKWRELLLKANQNWVDVANRHLTSLVNRKILRIGLRLKCSECSQHSWFDLESMSEILTCERCFQSFSFPTTRPPVEEEWHYKAVGPFSIENYAQGGYCVVLALRFFYSPHYSATCLPSFKLKDKSGKEIEADFGVFWREARLNPSDPILILGECKSFNNRFEAKDIKRAEALGKSFPGSVLAFCTLRKELDPGEKARIAKLTRRGRRYFRAGRWHNPVLVLTAIELFSSHGPPYCWEDAEEPYKKFAESYRHHKGIQELCNVTQQMHLGIESYWEWLEQERVKKQTRRSKIKQLRAADNE